MSGPLFTLAFFCLFFMLATARGVSRHEPVPTFLFQLALLAALVLIVAIVFGLVP